MYIMTPHGEEGSMLCTCWLHVDVMYVVCVGPKQDGVGVAVAVLGVLVLSVWLGSCFHSAHKNGRAGMGATSCLHTTRTCTRT